MIRSLGADHPRTITPRIRTTRRARTRAALPSKLTEVRIREVHAMATPSPAPARAGLLRWIVAFVGVVLVVLGAINMAAEVKYSMAGQREPGTIVSTEGGIGRKNSVDARAKI